MLLVCLSRKVADCAYRKASALPDRGHKLEHQSLQDALDISNSKLSQPDIDQLGRALSGSL